MKKLMFSLFKKVTNALQMLYPAHKLRKIPSIAPLYRCIYKTVKPKGIILITCQGNKMYLNAKDENIVPSLLIEGVYEKYETELFKKLIKPGMVVVDIGANIGYYTLIAAKLVKNYGRIYAFEPEPNNYKLLVKNIEINSYTNITPIQKAISNKHGKIKLFVDKLKLGCHSFSEDNVPEKNGFIEVETITLDDFFENIVKDNKVNLIKMDAEGAEGLIIKGARKLLRSNNLKIVMEFWPNGLKNVGTNPLKLLHKLQNYGFKIKLIDGINQFIKPIEIIKIMEMCHFNLLLGINRGHVNLLLEK